MSWTTRQSRLLGTSDGSPATVAIAASVKRQRWVQPQGGVQIDWGNPITKNLLGVYCAGVGYVGNAAKKIGTGSAASRYGIGGTGFATGSDMPSGSLVAGTFQPITVISFVSNPTDTSQHNIFSDNSGGSIQLRTNAGAIQLVKRATAVSITAGSVTATESFSVAASASGTLNKLYKNGVLIGSDATTLITGPASSVLAIGHDGAGGSTWIGSISFTASFARVLSDAEIASLPQNPYQIFASTEQKVWVPA